MAGKIFTVTNEKGGTGKTTHTTNYAVVLAHKGFNVVILDADPKPASATWGKRRKAFLDELIEITNADLETTKEQKKFLTRKLKPRPITVVRNRGEIDRTILSLREEYDFVLIDAGGMDEQEQRIAIGLSDTVICTTKTGQYDLDTSPRMVHIIKMARAFNRKLRAIFVINEAPTNKAMSNTQDAKEILSRFDDFELARTVIHKRNSYELTATYGLGVVEWSDSKARGEIEILVKEIFDV
ncbi:AAA family ATPase [Vibrio owensii]|uniref:AAA family ATPase n=1 Tax=Vibrio owensii TaxID=696485 RepID=UPI00339363F2